MKTSKQNINSKFSEMGSSIRVIGEVNTVRESVKFYCLDCNSEFEDTLLRVKERKYKCRICNFKKQGS